MTKEERPEIQTTPLEEAKRKKSRFNLKKIREELAFRMDQVSGMQTAQIRAKFMDRWAELSECPKDEDGNWDYSQIDYENKWVKIEFWLCDPKILFKIGDPKFRDRGIAMLPEDCRETFFQQAPGNSRPYSEIYTGMSALKQAIKKNRK